jgi:hypothetical protein
MMSMDEQNGLGGTPLDELEDGGENNLFKEFWIFLMENKIWWITPTVLILLLVVSFIIITVVTGGGPAAPFIYTLF